MDIKLRCMPGYRGIVPEPVIGAKALPEWFRGMANKQASETLGAEVPTFKQCPPLLDALRAGIVFPLATDVHVSKGELSWDWDLPDVPGIRTTQSPIGVHVPEQWRGAPLRADKGHFVVKFNNFWTIEAPKGVSLYFGHPFNREDLPFRSLSGVVDVDVFTCGFVHFPAIWIDPDFEGTLKRGTPIAQAIPMRREELTLDIGEFDDAALAEQITFQDALAEDTQIYRRKYRQPRTDGSDGGEE